jgi:hypothetical protein
MEAAEVFDQVFHLVAGRQECRPEVERSCPLSEA